MCFLVELIFAPGAVVCLVLFFRVAVSCRSGLVRLWLACAVCPVCWLMSAVCLCFAGVCCWFAFCLCVALGSVSVGLLLLYSLLLHTSKWKLSTQ